jgi:hypothetical protein
VEGLVARIIRRTGPRANKEQRTDQDDEESLLRHASMQGLGLALIYRRQHQGRARPVGAPRIVWFSCGRKGMTWQAGLDRSGIDLSMWHIHRKIGMSGGLFANALLRETGREVTVVDGIQLRELHGSGFSLPTPENVNLQWPHPDHLIWPHPCRLSVSGATPRSVQVIGSDGCRFISSPFASPPFAADARRSS